MSLRLKAIGLDQDPFNIDGESGYPFSINFEDRQWEQSYAITTNNENYFIVILDPNGRIHSLDLVTSEIMDAHLFSPSQPETSIKGHPIFERRKKEMGCINLESYCDVLACIQGTTFTLMDRSKRADLEIDCGNNLRFYFSDRILAGFSLEVSDIIMENLLTGVPLLKRGLRRCEAI